MGLLYVIGSYPNYFSKEKIFWNVLFQNLSKTKNKKQVVSPNARYDLY